ncbi:MAG TPA: carboxypeptidase-like regulatory domain-containing protein, partial [Candidatus Obscuribacterales bacterium]
MQLWFRQPRPLLVAAAALLLTLPTLLNGVASANAQSDADPPAASALPSPAATTNDPMPNPGLWGGSGLMTVPTAEILPWHGFHTSLSYFPLNSGLSVTGSVAILKDLEASLVFGVPPANGFSSLAASIKYRIMNQAEGQPISLALGASMLGLGDTLSYVPGSNIYLVLSHGFDWADLRLVNLHGGFMGGISGARLVAGADVPILDFARVELEYLGNFNLLSQAVNLGLVITPIDGLTLQAALLQRPSSFWDRDFVLSVGWRGDWAPLFGLETAASPSPSASPSPAPSAMPSATPTPSLQPPATDKGSVRIRAIDKERIIALETARVSLNQASTGLHFEANTDVTGEVRFERIPIGTYEIRLEKPGWAPETRMISVQTDLETFLEIP